MELGQGQTRPTPLEKSDIEKYKMLSRADYWSPSLKTIALASAAAVAVLS